MVETLFGQKYLTLGSIVPLLMFKNKVVLTICLHFLSVEGDLKDVRRKILHVIILMGHFKLSPLLFFPRKLVSHHFLFSLTLASSCRGWRNGDSLL